MTTRSIWVSVLLVVAVAAGSACSKADQAAEDVSAIRRTVEGKGDTPEAQRKELERRAENARREGAQWDANEKAKAAAAAASAAKAK